jgi:hypothetical protein
MSDMVSVAGDALRPASIPDGQEISLRPRDASGFFR